MKRIYPTSLIFITLFLIFNFKVFAQGIDDTKVIPPPTQIISDLEEKKRRIEAFEIVWQTINDNYFDQTFSGLDWNKIKIEYTPQVLEAKSDAEFHIILQKMISRLNRSHFGIIPREVFVAIEEAKERSALESREITSELSDKEKDSVEQDDVEVTKPGDTEDTALSQYGIGIDLRLINEKFLITRVNKNSPAEKAGIKAGYFLEKVNGVSLLEFLEMIRNSSLYVKSFDQKIPLQIIEGFLNGEKDSYVQLTVLDEKNQPKEFTIKREKISGEYVKILENLPELYLQFETRSINEEVGYIKFNYFALPIIDKFCQAITEFKDKKAIIIDLRGNKGGLFGSLMGISGFLTNREISLGTEITRTQKEVRDIKPHAKNFKGKTVILIDKLSYSAAEMFSAALQENDLATVIGEKSAGEALPSLTKVLPTGAVFLFPISNFKTPKGNFLEGNGIKPDYEVSLKRDNLLQGKDDQLDFAIETVRKQIAKEQSDPKSKIINAKPVSPDVYFDLSNTSTPNVRKIQQTKALNVIDDFIKTIGGKGALEEIESYKAKGKLELSRSGAVVKGEVEIIWISPNKYIENYVITGVGKISEIFDGQKYFIESEFTGSDEVVTPQVLEDKSLSMGFYEILKLSELYPQITHKGIFTVEGRKIHLIEATSAGGIQVAFNFDVETKLLVKRTSNWTGVIVFDNYQTVNDEVLLPHTIKKGTIFSFYINKYELNEKVEESLFTKKESCFDIVD